MSKKKLLVALTLITLFGCSNGGITVLKSEEAEFHETTYTAVGMSLCAVVWKVKRSEWVPGGFGIGETSKCTISLEKQKPFRRALLEKVISETDNLKGMRNFYWGVLDRGDATDEYSKRLMSAAERSNRWDSVQGKVTNPKDSSNGMVEQLLNEQNVFSEVSAVFAEKNLKLSVSTVEKVRITEGPKKLPFGGSVTFSVTKK